MEWRNHRTSIILAITSVLVISAFWFFPSLAFVVFLSLLLQLVLKPPVDKLAQKIPRPIAAGIVLISFIALSLGALTLISKSFVPTLTKFIADMPELLQSIQHLELIRQSELLNNELDEILRELLNSGVQALKSSLGLIFSLFNKILDLVIIIFVTFYLLKDGTKIKAYLARLFPHRDHERVMVLFDSILEALRVYICSQLVICAITGIVVFLYFTICDLPYASVFAVVSGVSEFVPVLGPTVASAFGTVLTATQTPLVALQTLGFYIVLTQINHNFVYPTLIGKSLNLHPVAIILGIVFGGEVLGAAGMFLAVPFIVTCKIVIEDIHRDKVI